MHEVKSIPPRPELRPCVRAYAQRRITPDHFSFTETFPAQLEQILEFDFGNHFDIRQADGRHQRSGDTNLIGLHTNFAEVHFGSGVDSFAIFFHPTGFWRLFGVPPAELSDQGGVDATALMGARIRQLWNRLGERPAFADRVQIADSFLFEALTHTLRPRPDIAIAVNTLFWARGNMRISDLASASGVGLRHLERRFLQEMGTTPKSFARIARFQNAVDAKIRRPCSPWIEIAHDFGYHDQMHMIHDFERLGGDAPARFLDRLGSMRPPELAGSELTGEFQ